jgi:hypothetical protein
LHIFTGRKINALGQLLDVQLNHTFYDLISLPVGMRAP